MQVRQHVPVLLALVIALVAISTIAIPVAGSPHPIEIEGNVSTANTTVHLQTEFLSEALVNTTTNYSVDVTNIGNKTDTITVRLNVENTTVDTTTVNLQPQNSTEVTLSANYTKPGEYNISFNTLESASVYADSCIGFPALCEQSANDIDDDGEYEDVNGDGSANIIDVGALLAKRNSDQIQNNINRYDFNDDGQVNIIDVGKLMAEVTS